MGGVMIKFVLELLGISGLFLVWCGLYFAVIPIIEQGWNDPVTHVLFLVIGLIGLLVVIMVLLFPFLHGTSSS